MVLEASSLGPLEEGNRGFEQEGNMPCPYLDDMWDTCQDIDSLVEEENYKVGTQALMESWFSFIFNGSNVCFTHGLINPNQ